LLLFIVLLLLLSLSLFALVSYSLLLICYSAIRLLSHKCEIKLSVTKGHFMFSRVCTVSVEWHSTEQRFDWWSSNLPWSLL